MLDEELLDIYFNSFTKNISNWLPDGFIDVNLSLLQKHDLLSFDDKLENSNNITHFFHLIEADDKLTLFNDLYIIWIFPDPDDEYPSTYTLIALNQDDKVNLEIGFKTTGVYNTSQYLLFFLEQFLEEIKENEETINRLKSYE